VVVAAGGCGTSLSDTGFVGTWQSTGNGTSTIAIEPAGDGYRFRWSLARGERTVRCDGEGLCEEFNAGEKIYEYRFEVDSQDGSTDLLVSCEGTPMAQDGMAVRYVDRLVLQPGATEIWSYMIEQDGHELMPPKGPRRFAKISDEPF